MTYGELISIIRSDLLDDIIPGTNEGYENSAWSADFMLRETINAVKQACYRKDLRHIYDESFRIRLKAGVKSYSLDPEILRIEEITLDGCPLFHTSLQYLDGRVLGWRDYDEGTPRRFYIRGRTLILDRAPSQAYGSTRLFLKVWREPFATSTVNDEIEWDMDVEKLGHWVAFKAFSRRDEDTQDPKKAVEHLTLFNMAFGEEVPARVRLELLQMPDTMPIAPHIDYTYVNSDSTGRW